MIYTLVYLMSHSSLSNYTYKIFNSKIIMLVGSWRDSQRQETLNFILGKP